MGMPSSPNLLLHPTHINLHLIVELKNSDRLNIPQYILQHTRDLT